MSKVTIEALAAMVQRGFKEAKDQLDQGLEEVVYELDEIKLLLTGHENRIAALEDQMRVVRTKLSGK